MEYQLRIYRIQAGKLDAFLAAWRTGVYPLRLAYGFAVVGAWVLADTSRVRVGAGVRRPGGVRGRGCGVLRLARARGPRPRSGPLHRARRGALHDRGPRNWPPT